MTTAALAPLDMFAAHDEPINHVAFAAERNLLATTDTAMFLKIWSNRELLKEVNLASISEKVRPTERIRALQFDATASRLFVAAGEQVMCYRVAEGGDEPDWSYIAPRLFAFLIVSPTALAVSDDGAVAAVFDNGAITFWKPTGERLGTIRHNAAPRAISFLPDETLLGTDSFSLTLWRLGERKPLWQRRSDERVYGMATSSDGKYVALRRLYTTNVYEVATGEQVVSHKQGRGLPLVAFARGSHCLAIGTQHAINLYDVPHSRHARLALDDAELISLASSWEGTQIVAGCSDGRVRIWENPIG